MGVPIVQQVIFWLGLSVTVGLLLRGLQTRLFLRFQLFYGYVSFVLLITLVEYFTYHFANKLYSPVYWTCEFSSAIIGCTIMFELYRQSLRPFPLLAGMANKVMLFVVALVVARILAGINWHSPLGLQTTLVALERDLRITQAIFLCGLLFLVAYYSVPMGRNLRGLALGYGIYLGLNIAHLTLRATMGDAFENTWTYLQPASFDVVFCIWLASLWVKDPVSQLSPSRKLDEDYARLIAATRKRLAQTEELLLRMIR